MANPHYCLILISSPFQYWCAMEYVYQEKIDNDIIVVDATSHCANSSQQVARLQDTFTPTQSFSLTIPKSGTLEVRIAAYADVFSSLRHTSFSHVLIGDLRQMWMQDFACNLKTDNVVLVDDGAATNVFEEYILTPAKYMLPVMMHESSAQRQEEALRIKAQFGIFSDATPVTLFSIFGFNKPGHTVINQLARLKAISSSSQVKIQDCHFVGSPVCEKGIVSQSHYFDILKNVVSEYKGHGRLIYFAHRAEALAEKKTTLEALGFEVQCHDKPYELVCAESRRFPACITGLHSTSLFNLKLLFGSEIDAICYSLGSSELDALKDRYWGSDRFTLYDHIISIYHRLFEFDIELKHLPNQRLG